MLVKINGTHLYLAGGVVTGHSQGGLGGAVFAIYSAEFDRLSSVMCVLVPSN